MEPSRAFLGLLSTRAQGEVAAFLIANGGESFSLEELREGTGLARASVRSAVDALVAWGQARVANPRAKRPRYMADEDSPITMALHLLTAAASDAAWPGEREFARVLAGVSDASEPDLARHAAKALEGAITNLLAEAQPPRERGRPTGSATRKVRTWALRRAPRPRAHRTAH